MAKRAPEVDFKHAPLLELMGTGAAPTARKKLRKAKQSRPAQTKIPVHGPRYWVLSLLSAVVFGFWRIVLNTATASMTHEFAIAFIAFGSTVILAPLLALIPSRRVRRPYALETCKLAARQNQRLFAAVAVLLGLILVTIGINVGGADLAKAYATNFDALFGKPNQSEPSIEAMKKNWATKTHVFPSSREIGD